MGFEVTIIEYLQSWSNSFLDGLIFAWTFLGDEMFFTIVAAVLYWCVSKAYAFRFINVYLWGAGVAEGAKNIFRRARPYQAHEQIRSIFKDTSGYSFPSGHVNSIAGISTQFAIKARREGKGFRIAVAAGCIAVPLVMFTRMYLGQHFLTDVLFGALSGVLLAMGFSLLYQILERYSDQFWKIILPAAMVVLTVVLAAGLAEKLEMLVKALGAYTAAAIGFSMEKKWVRYEVRSGKLWKQALKLVLGFAAALLILEGGKALTAWIEGMPGWLNGLLGFVRYFLTGFWVVFLAPAVFKACKL